MGFQVQILENLVTNLEKHDGLKLKITFVFRRARVKLFPSIISSFALCSLLLQEACRRVGRPPSQDCGYGDLFPSFPWSNKDVVGLSPSHISLFDDVFIFFDRCRSSYVYYVHSLFHQSTQNQERGPVKLIISSRCWVLVGLIMTSRNYAHNLRHPLEYYKDFWINFKLIKAVNRWFELREWKKIVLNDAKMYYNQFIMFFKLLGTR